MDEHRHTYWVYCPRGFGNEYTIIAVPMGHVPARKVTTPDGKVKKKPLNPGPGASLERVTRDKALKRLRATAPETKPTVHANASLCPYCDQDALQAQARERGDYSPLAGRVKQALQCKRFGNPLDQPASIPREE
jgi:hypothetical protein